MAEKANCPKCGTLCNIKPSTKGRFVVWCFRCRAANYVNYERPAVTQDLNFSPSSFQKAIFDWLLNGFGNAVVDAVAGAGKTTTIVHALNFTPQDSKVAFVAFNKHIAEALQKRAPAHVLASTLHSLALANVKRKFKDIRVEEDKIFFIMCDHYDKQTVKEFTANVQRLVSLLKGMLLEPTVANLEMLTDRHGIEMEDEGKGFKIALEVYARSIADRDMLDFDDMVFLCATKAVPCQKFDYMFVDEAQDMNPAQRKMILLSVKKTGRIIAVGDPHQAIYGWSGADTDSIPNFIKEMNATVLPLSISYRCPASVVRLAQMFVPQIEARPSAPEGKVEDISVEKFGQIVNKGDMVLCRTNAPLVAHCFALIRRGIKANIKGRNIGQGLIALINKAPAGDLYNTLDWLREYTIKEVGKAMATRKFNLALLRQDQFETIVAVADGCNTIAETKVRIEDIFTEGDAEVTLSSVHKAKGLEAKRVFVIEPQLMPHPMATQDWAKVQEQNIIYIATTRALEELYWVRS